MKKMIIDTSTQKLFLCFIENNKEFYRQELIGKNNHSDNLLKTIEQALDKHQLDVNNFNQIIIGIGPGLYTGLRVSLSVAKMFSWTLGIPLYTCSSLDLIASGHFNNPGVYVIKTRAKRDHVYCKVIEVSENIKTLVDDCFLHIDEFTELINKYPNKVIVDEDKTLFEPLLLPEIKKVTNLHFLEPNYLRGEL